MKPTLIELFEEYEKSMLDVLNIMTTVIILHQDKFSDSELVCMRNIKKSMERQGYRLYTMLENRRMIAEIDGEVN